MQSKFSYYYSKVGTYIKLICDNMRIARVLIAVSFGKPCKVHLKPSTNNNKNEIIVIWSLNVPYTKQSVCRFVEA